MLSSTHMIGGASAACLLLASTEAASIPLAAIAIGIGAVGGLIPDIDHPSSKISRTLRPVNALVSCFFTHRGVFHMPVLYIVLELFLRWLCPDAQYMILGRCLFAGIFSHLLLDALNLKGFPFSSLFHQKVFTLQKSELGERVSFAFG